MLQRISFNIGVFILYLFSFLPMSVLKVLGNGLGVLGYYLVKSRRRVGLINLSLCFPEMEQKEKEQIIRNHFKCLLTSGLEYSKVFFASKAEIQDIVKLKNQHFVLEHYAKRPVILLCPHFVGLDLAAIRLSTDICGIGIYSLQKNKYINDRLKQARTRFLANKDSAAFSRQEGLRPALKELKKTNYVFYYLPDQDFGEKESLYVPFFAHPTCATVKALPGIVKLCNALVVPTVVYRQGNGYVMEFFEPWDNYPSGDLEQDVIRMNKYVEKVVLKHMDEYFWLHKRFKTQPNGRHKLYKAEVANRL